MEQRLTFISLAVKNLKTALDYYENKFGWKKAERSNDNIVFFQLHKVQSAPYASPLLTID
jgi:uncharacterized protein